jgi:hypothetical protein
MCHRFAVDEPFTVRKSARLHAVDGWNQAIVPANVEQLSSIASVPISASRVATRAIEDNCSTVRKPQVTLDSRCSSSLTRGYNVSPASRLPEPNAIMKEWIKYITDADQSRILLLPARKQTFVASDPAEKLVRRVVGAVLNDRLKDFL